MSDPFIGEIRLLAFPRVPSGWLACNGQSIPISEYQTLYAVIGTTYGGDGQQTFNLPDLRGRVPIHYGQGANLPPYVIGELAGEDAHSLVDAEMPSHSHALVSSTAAATTATPSTTVHLGTVGSGNLYAPAANAAPYEIMAPCVGFAGTSLPHENIMPTLVCNYCICFNGIYPSSS
jgi:microcystin-dependent protein